MTRERNAVMLAKPFSERLVKSFGSWLISQPKLNGNHIKAVWNNCDCSYHLFSSTGIDRTSVLPTITKALNSINFRYAQFIEFDGEVYIPGVPHSETNGMINRKEVHPNEPQLQYHIFDTLNTIQPQIERLTLLKTVMSLCESDSLKFVDFKVLPNDKNYITDKLSFYMSEKFEGIILRNPSAYYRYGKVSDVLKIKPAEVDDYRITGAFEAIDKNGDPKGTLGGFFVVDARGNSFRLGAGTLNSEQRYVYWNDRDQLIGKTCHVKYQELSPNGIPEQAVLLSVI